MSSIKDCPFCGGKAVERDDTKPGIKVYAVWVECDKCGAQAGIQNECEYPDYRIIQNAERRARYAWNKRSGK